MDKKNNVLFISYDGMTDPLGQSQVIPYLKGLSNLGFNMYILSFEKGERYRQHGNLVKKNLEESNIKWIPKIYTKFPPVLSTIYDVFVMFRVVKGLIKNENIELLHCRSYISSIVGLYFKRKKNIKFLFDMRGFWADERVDGKLWNLRNPIYSWIYRFFKKKEIEFLNESDSIVSLTQVAKDEILTWPGVSILESKIKVIPCCVDLELFKKNNNQPRSIGVLNFCYLGSLGTWYLTREVIELFEKILIRFPHAHLNFFTPDKPEIIYKLLLQTKIAKHCISISFLQRNELPDVLSNMDIAIYFVKPTYSKISSSPTKQGELLSMGIPVITNDKIGDSTPIIEGKNVGFVLKGFSQEEYNKAVDSIEHLLEIPKGNIRDIAIATYSLEMGIENYNKIYCSIL